jgi:hypothetical protein
MGHIDVCNVVLVTGGEIVYAYTQKAEQLKGVDQYTVCIEHTLLASIGTGLLQY